MRIFLLTILALCYFYAPLNADSNHTLYLLDQHQKIVYQTPIKSHERFAIKFTHSVARTEVEEWFQINAKHICLVETIYEDFGAGLPFETTNAQTMLFKNGKIILTGFDMQFKQFDVRVGRIAKHRLLVPVNNKLQEIKLDTLVAQGQAITFTLTPP